MNESHDTPRTLVEFLSVLRNPYALSGDELRDTRHQAADRIEALVADNAKLRKALENIHDALGSYPRIIECDRWLDIAHTALTETEKG